MAKATDETHNKTTAIISYLPLEFQVFARKSRQENPETPHLPGTHRLQSTFQDPLSVESLNKKKCNLTVTTAFINLHDSTERKGIQLFMDTIIIKCEKNCVMHPYH